MRIKKEKENAHSHSVTAVCLSNETMRMISPIPMQRSGCILDSPVPVFVTPLSDCEKSVFIYLLNPQTCLPAPLTIYQWKAQPQ